MSFVLFTPPTRDVGMVHDGQSAAMRGVARMAQPLKVGKTLYKKNGTWRLEASPSADAVAGADPVYVGGHWYYVAESILQEIIGQGLDIDYVPDPAGTWPSSGTHPASNLYPGVA